MKLLFFFLIFSPLISFEQKIGFQAAPLAEFSNRGGSGFGGEIITSVKMSQSVSLGAGVNAITFKNCNGIYKPIFATIKINIPVKIFVLNFDANLGDGIYNNSITTGGFYFASGLTFATLKNIGPYLSVHYSNYQFHTKKALTSTTIRETHQIEGVSISLGNWFKI